MTETQHQISFVKWLEVIHTQVLFWHTPNGEPRSPAIGAKLKRMGVLAGVPDLFFPEYRLFIELKNTTGSLSYAQIELKPKLERCGYHWVTAYGFPDAVEKFTVFIGEHPLNAAVCHNKKI